MKLISGRFMQDHKPKSAETILPRDYPPVLDLSYYRSVNSDLRDFADDQLQDHFRNYGEIEGRAGSPHCFRQTFLQLISPTARTLEIGPFCNPQLRGAHVRYFDVGDREYLIKRAIELQYPFTDAPAIDYVSPIGDMEGIDDEFGQIFSSHCIEHQPNLVRHLNQVSQILKNGGCYFLVVPDKRFCFDHYLPETTIADVLGSHIEKRHLHYAKSVLEHRLLTTHNEPIRHWQGDHGAPLIQRTDPRSVSLSIDYVIANVDTYLDTHGWHFTPNGFQYILDYLYQLGLTKLHVNRVYNTPFGQFEFCAILTKL